MEKISLDYFGVYDRPYHVYRKDHSVTAEKAHFHDYYQLCFVSRGEIEHRQYKDTEKAVRLCRGDAFLIPPYFAHSVHFEDTYSEICSLCFREELFMSGFEKSESYRFLKALTARGGEMRREPVHLRVHLAPATAEVVEALFECLIREMAPAMHPAAGPKTRTGGQKDACDQDREKAGQDERAAEDAASRKDSNSAAAHIVLAILAYISDAYLMEAPYHAEKREILEERAVISKSMEYIDAHFTEPMELSEIAKHAAMSRSRFAALFPQFSGQTLKQYVMRKRVLYAERLMHEQPHLTITEIAEMCGYEEASTFYRNFRKVTGLSPSRYKNGS